MRICAFGASSRDLDALYIDAAYELGRTLAEHGHGLVFGGYDVGLMGAVAHGVGDAGGSVIGVVTEGLNKKGRPVYPCTELICEYDLATRKTRMTSLADAFVTLPGGLGTFDEFFDIVSQVKAGELDAKSAILNVGGYLTRWSRCSTARPPRASTLPTGAATATCSTPPSRWRRGWKRK